MGKMIDADKIMDKMESTFDMQELYLPIQFKELIIDDMPSIEAIPKADYENRLKADMVAMLKELQDEMFKQSWRLECICDDLDGSAVDWDDIKKIIQQKINALKENKNE